MTIEECMKKICWRSMATPFTTERWDATTCLMAEVTCQPRLCVGNACMAFAPFERFVDKDGKRFDPFKMKKEDKVVEVHGYCTALFYPPQD